jgi:hypothetical protein
MFVSKMKVIRYLSSIHKINCVHGGDGVTWQHSWLRYCTTVRKVAGSILYKVITFFKFT